MWYGDDTFDGFPIVWRAESPSARTDPTETSLLSQTTMCLAVSRCVVPPLDLLEQAWTSLNRQPRQGGLVTDVGCANFWYARTLHTFFRPAMLTGVEFEGFRLYPTGYSRYDSATGYVADLPHTAFVVADYCEVKEPVDVITAWVPFVTPVLAWRLPLTLVCPERLFTSIARNHSASTGHSSCSIKG